MYPLTYQRLKKMPPEIRTAYSNILDSLSLRLDVFCDSLEDVYFSDDVPLRKKLDFVTDEESGFTDDLLDSLCGLLQIDPYPED